MLKPQDCNTAILQYCNPAVCKSIIAHSAIPDFHLNYCTSGLRFATIEFRTQL